MALAAISSVPGAPTSEQFWLIQEHMQQSWLPLISRLTDLGASESPLTAESKESMSQYIVDSQDHQYVSLSFASLFGVCGDCLIPMLTMSSEMINSIKGTVVRTAPTTPEIPARSKIMSAQHHDDVNPFMLSPVAATVDESVDGGINFDHEEESKIEPTVPLADDLDNADENTSDDNKRDASHNSKMLDDLLDSESDPVAVAPFITSSGSDVIDLASETADSIDREESSMVRQVEDEDPSSREHSVSSAHGNGNQDDSDVEPETVAVPGTKPASSNPFADGDAAQFGESGTVASSSNPFDE